MLRRLAAATTASLMLAGGLLPAAAPPPHPALARGLALMREGDFEAAVLELDAAARKIEADPAAARHRAWAYVYLGVAYLELEQEAVARGKFREALARDPGVRLEPAEFSAQSIRVFEGVRAEAAAVAAVPAPARPRPSPVASAAPVPEKKGSKGPLVAVLLGGAAAAGAAVALGGGGGDSGGSTTLPGGSTTLPAPVPSPSASPSEPPSTQPPATQPPVTTPPTAPAACTYSLGGATPPAFPVQGGNGTCRVTTSRPDCSWTAVTNANWIGFQNATGQGNGTVAFNVEPNTTLAARSAAIRLLEGNQPACTVSQAAAVLTAAGEDSSLAWTSDLQVSGGRGQVIVDGSSVTFQENRSHQGWIKPGGVRHRIEGTLVTGAGRPGTWRFQVPAGAKPGSLRVVAGDVAAIAADTVTFRLAGRPGERVVFTFAPR